MCQNMVSPGDELVNFEQKLKNMGSLCDRALI